MQTPEPNKTLLFVQAFDNQGTAPTGWGSHIHVNWCDFEPASGVYRLDLFTQAIARRVRPCYVQLGFSFLDKVHNVPVDYTPAHHRRSLKLQAGTLMGAIPPYDATWITAYGNALTALAMGLREHPQVAGYWHAAGWNNETQAAVKIRGVDWAASAQSVLSSVNYYDFITRSTMIALDAWGNVPVYLPGSPAPGAVWGTKRRDIIVDCLRAGANYLNCGLACDNSTSVGLGERAGQGMYDIGSQALRRGFEEGERQDRSNFMELYWLLLRARHWQADFVSLYASISAPQATEVIPLLPAENARWIVFRDAEWPANVFTSGGKIYGFSGELGNWGYGITTDVTPTRGGAGFGFDRWVLTATEPLVLTLSGVADGLYQVTTWQPEGGHSVDSYYVTAERLTLPPGRYHRIDVTTVPLTLDERVTRLELRLTALENTRTTGDADDHRKPVSCATG